jgi:hypothetical protein
LETTFWPLENFALACVCRILQINDIPLFSRKGYTGEQYLRSVIDQCDGLQAGHGRQNRLNIGDKWSRCNALYGCCLSPKADLKLANAASGND